MKRIGQFVNASAPDYFSSPDALSAPRRAKRTVAMEAHLGQKELSSTGKFIFDILFGKPDKKKKEEPAEIPIQEKINFLRELNPDQNTRAVLTEMLGKSVKDVKEYLDAISEVAILSNAIFEQDLKNLRAHGQVAQALISLFYNADMNGFKAYYFSICTELGSAASNLPLKKHGEGEWITPTRLLTLRGHVFMEGAKCSDYYKGRFDPKKWTQSIKVKPKEILSKLDDVFGEDGQEELSTILYSIEDSFYFDPLIYPANPKKYDCLPLKGDDISRVVAVLLPLYEKSVRAVRAKEELLAEVRKVDFSGLEDMADEISSRSGPMSDYEASLLLSWPYALNQGNVGNATDHVEWFVELAIDELYAAVKRLM